MTATQIINEESLEQKKIRYNSDPSIAYLRVRLLNVYACSELLGMKEENNHFTPIYSQRTLDAVAFWEQELKNYIQKYYPDNVATKSRSGQ
jgi:hypothetical protein